MGSFQVVGDCLIWREDRERLEIRAWGSNAIRVRSTLNARFSEIPHALMAEKADPGVITVENKRATLRSDSLEARVSDYGRIRFFRDSSKEPLLEEVDWTPWARQLFPSARQFASRDDGLFRSEVTFSAKEGERFYGLGQHRHGLLDQKGAVIELAQRNAEVSIPFLISSRGYGFLWNNPGIGRVELAANRTRWVAEGCRQVDYVVFAGDTFAAIMESYANASGHAPMIPDWATGFWQSKLRYRSQEELLRVAAEYRARGLPLSVIVVDFFHWTKQGEWKWDPARWPDPRGMIQALDAMGVKLMVSIWPTVNPRAETAAEMRDRGLLVSTDQGNNVLLPFVDVGETRPVYLHHYDATNPEAREFIWSRVKKSYHDNGVALYWLDACEPEIYPLQFSNLRFHAGAGVEVACLYPFMHQKAFFDGLALEGRTQVMILSRSAWAGSQRFGAAVWSGDLRSDWETLRAQVKAGLNIGMSGIPWWTTDIGGFYGGDPRDAGFRELLIRWFQWGVFCPLFRLHGMRDPVTADGDTGSDNEAWSFGEEAYAIIRELLLIRERLRPYIMEQARRATDKGLPLMRPLFFDFPNDPQSWSIEDEHLFGPDIIVAPVLGPGQRSREVYLPDGAGWRDAWSGEPRESGRKFVEPAPLQRIPVFLREGAGVTLGEVGPMRAHS